MKKSFFIFLFLLVFIFPLFFIFAQTNFQFEVEYPPVGGERPTSKIEDYIKYLYNLAIIGGAILAFVVFVIGGLRYLYSAGNPRIQSDAKNQIFSALFGLLILIISYLLLSSVSPKFVIFQLREPPHPTSTIQINPEEEYNPATSTSQRENLNKELEIKYPEIRGFRPETVKEKVGEYINYLYNFSIMICGVLGFVIFLIGAIKYLTSAGNLSRAIDAKEQIFSAFLGILILLSTYLILKILKPSFTNLEIKEIKEIEREVGREAKVDIQPGIWLCSKEIPSSPEIPIITTPEGGIRFSLRKSFPLDRLDEKTKRDIANHLGRYCYRPTGRENLPSWIVNSFNSNAIYIVGNYGAILHVKEDFRGGCYYIWPALPPGYMVHWKTWTSLSFRSITPFVDNRYQFGDEFNIEFTPEDKLAEFGPGATLFEHRDFNEGKAGLKRPIQLGLQRIFATAYYSLKVDKEKKWVVSLGTLPVLNIDDLRNDSLGCEVFTESDYNLEDNYVGSFGGEILDGKIIKTSPKISVTFLTPGVIGEKIAQTERDPCFEPLLEDREPQASVLVEFFKKIYNYGVRIGGIITFFSLVIGSLKYLISTGDVGRQMDAKDQIISAFLGLVILLASFEILRTLKPDFVLLKIKELKTPPIEIEEGTWICKKSIANFENYINNPKSLNDRELKNLRKEVDRCCYRPTAKENVPNNFRAFHKENGEIYYYIFKGYGLVFHDRIDSKGNCRVSAASGSASSGKISTSQSFKGISSVTPFLLRSKEEISGQGVAFYRYRDFNEGKNLGSGDEKRIGKEQIPPRGKTFGISLKPAYSIKIDKEKEWVVIAWAYTNGGEICPGAPSQEDRSWWCDVYDQSDNDLMDNFASEFCFRCLKFERFPCIGSATIYPGKILRSPEEIIRYPSR